MKPKLNSNGNGNGVLMRYILGSLLALAQLIIGAVLLWVGGSVVEMGKSITALQRDAIAQATRADERFLQTTKDIADIKSTASAVAQTAITTAATLANTVSSTAAAYAAVQASQAAEREARQKK